MQSFADALLVVPKTLAENSGFDVIDSILGLKEVLTSHSKVVPTYSLSRQQKMQ